MPYYSNERKAELLQMMLPPLNLTITEVSRREGVTAMSLRNWRKRVRDKGYVVVTDPDHPTESWSAEMKFAAVVECASLSEIELGEYCRRKGLFPEQIAAWRQTFLSGMSPERQPQKVDREQTRQDQKRIQQLERELNRKDKALAETAALLVLRKKLNDYWGVEDEDN